MNATDLMPYDGFAYWLGRRYEGITVLMDRDDIYQVAMMGLARSFERRPDAKPWRRRNDMRWAVLAELTKQLRRLAPLPLDGQRRTATEDNAASTAQSRENVEAIGRAMAALPDTEFQMVALKAMGYNPVATALQHGMSMQQSSQALRLGIKRMRAYVAELEVAM